VGEEKGGVYTASTHILARTCPWNNYRPPVIAVTSGNLTYQDGSNAASKNGRHKHGTVTPNVEAKQSTAQKMVSIKQSNKEIKCGG